MKYLIAILALSSLALAQQVGLDANAVKLNGATVVTSAPCVGTNASGQLLASACSYATDVGAVNAYSVALSPAPTALFAGLRASFLPGNANTTTTPTLNLNALGAKTITKNGTAALAAGDLTTTAIATVVYDGIEWQLQNPQTSAASSASFAALTSGTNTTLSGIVGTGASLTVSGSGTIAATSVPASGITGTIAAASFPAITGDTQVASGTTVSTTTKVNGTSVPTTTTADTALVTSAANVGLWTPIPLCNDSGGNHLNYNTASHSFSCGTSGGTAGSAAFNTLTGGTNGSAAMIVGTGSSLSATGTGTIAATSVLASGISGTVPVANGGLNTTAAPSSGQIPVASSATTYSPVTVSGDATLSSAGALTVTKTNGVVFAPSATTDTTNASNISSGTLSASVLPIATTAALGAVKPDGTTITITGAGVLSTVAGTSNSAALTVGTIADGTCSADQTFTLTGLSPNQSFTWGLPSTLPAGLIGTMYASAANTVSVRVCNFSGASATVGALTYSASLGGGGAGGAASSVPVTGVTGLTFTGNTTKAASSTGALTSGDCAKWDASGNIIDAGSPCGVGGSSAFSALTGSTNTSAAMVVGSGASLGATGTGTITATSVPGGGITGANSIPASALPIATTAALGGVKPDGTSITVSASGVISAPTSGLPAQTGNAAYLISNGTSASWGDLITGPSGALCAGTGCSGGTPGIIDIVTSKVPVMSSGLIQPANLPTATTASLGAVKVDGTTITINGSGVISSVGGGSGSTSNKTLASGVATINLASCASGGTLPIVSYTIPAGTLSVGNQVRQRVSLLGGAGATPTSSTYIISTFGNGTTGNTAGYLIVRTIGLGEYQRVEANWNQITSSSSMIDGVSMFSNFGGGLLTYPDLTVNGIGTLVNSTDAISGSITTGMSIGCGTTTGWTGTLYARYSLELWY